MWTELVQFVQFACYAHAELATIQMKWTRHETSAEAPEPEPEPERGNEKHNSRNAAKLNECNFDEHEHQFAYNFECR